MKLIKNQIKKYFFSNFVITSIFFVLLYLALLGRVVSVDNDIYLKIGRFIVRPYKYGLYLTERDSEIFRNFSIYDFKIIDPSNETSTSYTRHNLSNVSIESTYRQKPTGLTSKIMALSSYFKFAKPTATFNFDGNSLQLESERNGRNLILSLNQNKDSSMENNTVVLTFSFDESDFIFDNEGYLYAIKTTENIEDYLYANNILLTPKNIDIPNVEITNKILYITNNETAGVIKINLLRENLEKVVINRDKKLIEFQIKKGEKPYIILSLLDSLKEVTND